MDRYFRNRIAERPNESPPSEAWFFAQALHGNPVPSASEAEAEARAKREQYEFLEQIAPERARELRGQLNPEAEARANRELLEFLEQIAPERAREMRGRLNPEAEARANRELLEFLEQIALERARELRDRLSEEAEPRAEREYLESLAAISPRHESQLRNLSRTEAEYRDAQERRQRPDDGSTLHEAQWDSAKHPRGGYPQNRGWFSSIGASGGVESPRVGPGQGPGLGDADSGARPPFFTVSDKSPKQGPTRGDPAVPAVSPTTKPQLPADHRGEWISGTKGDGVFRYNDSAKNQQAGLAGKEVRYTNQYIAIGGFPAEAYYRGSAAKASVEIKNVTGFDADKAASDAAMRQKLGNPSWQRPKGYIWNHAGPPGSKTMELVDAQYHVPIGHKGSAAELRALQRAAKGRGATGRATGVLTVYLTTRDALRAGGVLQPEYVVAEQEMYRFVAEDGSEFIVWGAGWFSSAKREFVGGPRKGQTETITNAQVEQYRKKAEEEWGKYIPATLFSEPRFIPGKQRQELPLIIDKYGIPHDAGYIDEKGVHLYSTPRPRNI